MRGLERAPGNFSERSAITPFTGRSHVTSSRGMACKIADKLEGIYGTFSGTFQPPAALQKMSFAHHPVQVFRPDRSLSNELRFFNNVN